MPEFHNPNLESYGPGRNNDVRPVLVLIALVLILLFGFKYVRQPQSRAPAPAGHAESRAVQPETAQVPSLVDYKSITSSGSFGWLAFIARPLYLALRLVHDHGVGNWGWSIIVLTAIFNLLLTWPRLMSMKSSLKMMRVQPKVDALKKRCAHLNANDSRLVEMNAELMDLYRAEGASMFGGCVPLLFQMPLLFAYVSVLRNAAELRQAHWLWLTDLSLPDLASSYHRDRRFDAVHHTRVRHECLSAVDVRHSDACDHGPFSLALCFGTFPILGNRQHYQPVYPVCDESQQVG